MSKLKLLAKAWASGVVLMLEEAARYLPDRETARNVGLGVVLIFWPWPAGYAFTRFYLHGDGGFNAGLLLTMVWFWGVLLPLTRGVSDGE